jgi:hypothetical protein
MAWSGFQASKGDGPRQRRAIVASIFPAEP